MNKLIALIGETLVNLTILRETLKVVVISGIEQVSTNEAEARVLLTPLTLAVNKPALIFLCLLDYLVAN